MVDGSVPTEKSVIAVVGPSSVDMTVRQPPLEWIRGASQDRYTPEMVQNVEDPPLSWVSKETEQWLPMCWASLVHALCLTDQLAGTQLGGCSEIGSGKQTSSRLPG